MGFNFWAWGRYTQASEHEQFRCLDRVGAGPVTEQRASQSDRPRWYGAVREGLSEEVAGKLGITGGAPHMTGPGWESCRGHRWHDYCQSWADLFVIPSSGYCSFSIGCLHHPHLFLWNITTSCTLVLSFLMECLHLFFILDHDFANIDKNGSHFERIRPKFVCDSDWQRRFSYANTMFQCLNCLMKFHSNRTNKIHNSRHFQILLPELETPVSICLTKTSIWLSNWHLIFKMFRTKSSLFSKPMLPMDTLTSVKIAVNNVGLKLCTGLVSSLCLSCI